MKCAFPFSPATRKKLDIVLTILLACAFLPAVILIIRLATLYPNFSGIPEVQIIISVYRGTGIMLAVLVMFGLNVLAWDRAELNYAELFHMKSRRQHTKPLKLTQAALGLFCVWGWSLYLCLAGIRENVTLFRIPYWVHPFAWFFTCIVVLLLPFNVLGRNGRFWILGSLARIAAVACIPAVIFRDFFVADQLNSLVIVLYDIEYSMCYYASDQWFGTKYCLQANLYIRPIIAVLPALSRFIHCVRRWRDTGAKFPHLANAAKYSCAWFIVLFGTLAAHVPVEDEPILHYMWAAVAVFASVYNWAWDCTMDFGILNRRARYPWLRDRLMFSWTWTYYAMIGADFVLRFAWALSLTPILTIINSEMLLLLASFLEVTRRFLWNFFRLEWEHTTTTGDDARPLHHPSRDYKDEPALAAASINSESDSSLHSAVSMPSLDQLASSGVAASADIETGRRTAAVSSGGEYDERTPLRTAVTPPEHGS